MDAPSKQPIPWKKITKIVFWLWGFPPAGLWMLWRDATMTRAMKTRVLIYAIAIPVALSILWMNHEYNAAVKAINAGGGGF